MPIRCNTTAGLSILVEELPATYSVAVGGFVGVGTRFEPAAFSGICHLIEHMCFKGTQNLPNAKLISQEIEGVGGILNAATSYESTVYWSKVAHIHFGRAVHTLTELLLHPLFDARELEKERRVVIEEIRGTQDSPGEWIHELVHQALWGDQPLGRDIAGSIATVNALQCYDLLSFWENYYTQANMVISIAGNINAEQVITAITNAFGNHTVGTRPVAPPTQAPCAGPSLLFTPKETEQGSFCLAVPSLSYMDPDRRALQVLDTIIGGGMASRLFQELREERGMAYNVGSYSSEVVDTGMWVVYGSVETDVLHESIETVFTILRDITMNGVTEAELDYVKEHVKGGILLSLEDTGAIASRNGTHLLRYGEVIPVEQVIAEVEQVTREDVLRVAQKILRNQALHLAVIGPYDDHDEQALRTLVERGV